MKKESQDKDISTWEVSGHEKGDGISIITKAPFFEVKNYPIPKLALLDDMVSMIKNAGNLPDLRNTIFIGVQHILETTVSLFDALIALGVKPENMYFSGKCYSTAPVIANELAKRKINLMESNKPEELGEYEKYCLRGIAKMWQFCIDRISNQKIDRIIILDEGGRCLESMPEFVGLNYTVAAIEQTRAGLYSESVNLLNFPFIEVASSAAKKILEPPLIATAITKRLENTLNQLNPDQRTTAFGVIGNGAIGNAICKFLLERNYNVVVYDENESAFQNIINKNFFRVDSIEKLIVSTNIIFGCTGKDVTKGIDILSIVKRDKIFISCTSEDKEFRSLLQVISHQQLVAVDVLSDIVCKSKNGSRIHILQGGFPFNFDRLPWNVPAEDIEITQGLLLGGCIQAITAATKPIKDGYTINQGCRQSLDPSIQRYVALHWLARQPKTKYPAQYHELFNDEQWIQKNSGGSFYKNDFTSQQFSNKNLEATMIKTPRAKL